MGRSRSRQLLLGATVVALSASVTAGNAQPSSLPPFEKLPAAKAMASVFSHPSPAPVPATLSAPSLASLSLSRH
jgi:hypothetical protein